MSVYRGVLRKHAGIAQLGERQTEDLKVAGSIPAVGIFLFCLFFSGDHLRAGSLRSPALGQHGTLAEWLRRSIRNRLGIARGSSNLSGVVLIFFGFFFLVGHKRLNIVSPARPPLDQVLVAQWIAHQTSNLGVAGSNPVEHELLILFLGKAWVPPFRRAWEHDDRLYSSVGRACAS